MNYKIFIFILSFLTLSSACKDTNSPGSEETGDLTTDSLMQKNNNTKNEPITVEIYTWVNKLRMRSKPDTKSDIIAELVEGEALTYLDEKTDFTQKISMRGSIQDEPWLKVKTKTGKIGWVYGGGVKFYRPRVDAAPSPFAACFKTFAKDNRYPAFTTCVDQVSNKQLRKDRRFVNKESNGLVFTLLSGKKKALTWSPATSDAPDAGYHYRYYLPQMGFFVVERKGENNNAYLLINDKSGRETPLWGFPKASPDFKHLFVASTDLVPEFESFGLRIYGFTDEGFQKMGEYELEDVQPILVQWTDDKTVAITFRPMQANSGKKQHIGELKLQGTGTWALEIE